MVVPDKGKAAVIVLWGCSVLKLGGDQASS